MKKAIILVIIILVGCFLTTLLVNYLNARNVTGQLFAVPLPDHTVMVESISATGKLAGNGNGMQFFGAILIHSELTLDELSAYYAQELPNAVVKEQKTPKIACVEHRAISFHAAISDTQEYYIVYLFGNGIFPFSNLDIRGH